ncbi:hypothetical protein D3C72_2024140 [compost metagenome]
MDVVVVLAGIVEEAGILAIGLLDDVLERQDFQPRAFQQLFAIGHVSLVVLVVMIFERFSRHVGAERIIGVGQGRQGEFRGHLGLRFGIDAEEFRHWYRPIVTTQQSVGTKRSFQSDRIERKGITLGGLLEAVEPPRGAAMAGPHIGLEV